MTNEMMELADRIDTCIRKRIYDVGLSQGEKAEIAAALRSTAAQAALPAQGEPVRDQLVNALSAIEQRANESVTGEMGLLDTVHAMARIARVALALVPRHRKVDP